MSYPWYASATQVKVKTVLEKIEIYTKLTNQLIKRFVTFKFINKYIYIKFKDSLHPLGWFLKICIHRYETLVQWKYFPTRGRISLCIQHEVSSRSLHFFQIPIFNWQIIFRVLSVVGTTLLTHRNRVKLWKRRRSMNWAHFELTHLCFRDAMLG